MSEKQQIAVIGAGVVGRTIALKLQQQGAQVTLFDPSTALDAPSWNNAGHIAIEQIAPLASINAIMTAYKRLFAFGGALDFALTSPGVIPWIGQYLKASLPKQYRFGVKKLAELISMADPAWSRLVASIDAEDLYQRAGHYVLWESKKSALTSTRKWSATDIGSCHFLPLEGGELSAATAPLKTPVFSGIRFVGTGQIQSLSRLAVQLERAFLSAGGTIVNEKVRPLTLQHQQAAAVTESGNSIKADHFVVSAGVHSADLLANIHPHIPLIAERGYHIEAEVSEAAWPSTLPPLVFEDRSMIVTRYANTLRACSFVEFAHKDTQPDKRKWQQLIAHCQALGIPLNHHAKQWMGARPTLPDYLPAIGTSSKASNLSYAFGHQHLGLTLSAATAELVASLLQQGDAGSLASGLCVERFE